ncbi:MAG: hypothetical protein AAF651_10065, partial [Cyanobacteria bacterium P01_C01_bin.73]
ANCAGPQRFGLRRQLRRHLAGTVKDYRFGQIARSTQCRWSRWRRSNLTRSLVLIVPSTAMWLDIRIA